MRVVADVAMRFRGHRILRLVMLAAEQSLSVQEGASMTPHPKPEQRGPMRLVIFFRADGFYPLELPDTDDLSAHAGSNPGTLRIEDASGNVLWRLQ